MSHFLILQVVRLKSISPHSKNGARSARHSLRSRTRIIPVYLLPELAVQTAMYSMDVYTPL